MKKNIIETNTHHEIPHADTLKQIMIKREEELINESYGNEFYLYNMKSIKNTLNSYLLKPIDSMPKNGISVYLKTPDNNHVTTYDLKNKYISNVIMPQIDKMIEKLESLDYHVLLVEGEKQDSLTNTAVKLLINFKDND